jgi:NADH-quinone oxidoreductase subunit J
MVLPAPLLAATSAIQPVVILILCVVAGVGTVLLLPGRRDTSLSKVGGVILAAAGLILVGLLVKYANDRAGERVSVYFWIFSAIAILGAVRVVTHARPVYSALYFVLTIFASAGLFVLMWAEFMAAALVIIYAGAVLITYVFVIMLAASSTSTRAAVVVAEYDTISREPVAATAVGFALMGILLFLIFDKAGDLQKVTTTSPGSTPPGSAVVDRGLPENAPIQGAFQAQGGTQELGQYLFENQIINVQLSGLLLTLGMAGAILIARRKVVTVEVPQSAELITTPATPMDDNPHSIPVYGTDNPRAKAYPET